ITGNAESKYESDAKLVEILKEIAPKITRVAVIYASADRSWVGRMEAVEGAASALKMQMSPVEVHDENQIEDAIAKLAQEPNFGLVVFPTPFAVNHNVPIIQSVNQHKLPAIYPFRYFVAQGGLISYGTDFIEGYRQAAVYIDRILRGERPGELPVQALTKLEL